MTEPRPVVEICVESAAGAIAARHAGAERVELCADLLEGGITPSVGTIEVVRAQTDGGLFVMIRPRGGDFCYSKTELEVMARDIDAAKAAGADGIVLGLLRPNGTIDVERTAALAARARPMQVTFHRAFDMTRDPLQAFDDLLEIGVDRLLTSGQCDSVADGVELVRTLVARAGDRLIVMPGAGLDESNVGEVVARTGAREVHFAALRTQASPMTYRNPHCTMGAPIARGEYERCETDPQRVMGFLAALSPA